MAAYVDKTVTGRSRCRTRRFRVPHETPGDPTAFSSSGPIAPTFSDRSGDRSASTKPRNRRGLSFSMFIRAGAAIAVSNDSPPLSRLLTYSAMQRVSRHSTFALTLCLSSSSFSYRRSFCPCTAVLSRASPHM